MKLLSALCLTLLLAAPAYALDSDRDQPANLTADELDLDLKTGERIYRGNVLFEQGSIRIECDELTTQFDQAGELAGGECVGKPGRFKQRPQDSEDDLIGIAESIQFDRDTDLVTLTGEAQVIQGNFNLSGESILYDVSTERVLASGLQRDNVRPTLVIQPRNAPPQAETAGESDETAAEESTGESETAAEESEDVATEESDETAAEESAAETDPTDPTDQPATEESDNESDTETPTEAPAEESTEEAAPE